MTVHKIGEKMAIYKIPLINRPNQTLTCNINNQTLDITLNTRNEERLFITLKVNNTLIVANRVCLNGIALVKNNYADIACDLVFIDTQGKNDPHYSGLGYRYQLMVVTDE